jgi:Lsr2
MHSSLSKGTIVAERIVRQLIDDIDKTEIPEGKGERIEFSFRGATYRIDLNDTNVAKLEKALAPYIESATKVGPSNGRRRGAKKVSRTTSPPRGEENARIRKWAATHGHIVSARGRIPAAVVEAYQTAHAGSAPAARRRRGAQHAGRRPNSKDKPGQRTAG